jgi:hypothetical protein
MRAIASATDVIGAVGVGGPAGMATLYEKPVARPVSGAVWLAAQSMFADASVVPGRRDE